MIERYCGISQQTTFGPADPGPLRLNLLGDVCQAFLICTWTSPSTSTGSAGITCLRSEKVFGRHHSYVRQRISDHTVRQMVETNRARQSRRGPATDSTYQEQRKVSAQPSSRPARPLVGGGPLLSGGGGASRHPCGAPSARCRSRTPSGRRVSTGIGGCVCVCVRACTRACVFVCLFVCSKTCT
jgi:hypothetical protein